MHTPGADTDSPSDTPPNSVYIPGAPHCIVLQPAHISPPEGSQDMAGVHFGPLSNLRFSLRKGRAVCSTAHLALEEAHGEGVEHGVDGVHDGAQRLLRAVHLLRRLPGQALQAGVEDRGPRRAHRVRDHSQREGRAQQRGGLHMHIQGKHKPLLRSS